MPVLLFVLSQSLPNQHSHKQMQTIWLQPILLMVPLIQPWACVEMLKRLHLRTTVLIKYLSTASVVIKQFDFEGKKHRASKREREAKGQKNSESISLISAEQGMDIYELDRQIESSRQYQHTSEEIRQNTIKAIKEHGTGFDSFDKSASIQELAGYSKAKIAEFMFETTI
ncbi:Oidioi.mRNA.OKI2018_I69.XSR.g16249.t1.cds [Oikopleura dioica]|uniref:Oidioi.mRNA.OKI2018_I69.XSR.g16249.t1.cds n=1 Tax=Oikopleura dioica TaxID=34765 RepID=A0ABN7SJG0_OIKDI|nr:Oidioi.mRNA.OKI2018_I69.XSR.g16249.t1.cds [Oikopleura dioica]